MRSILISQEFEGFAEKTPIHSSVYNIYKLLYNVNRRKKGEKMNIGERLKSVRLQAGLSLRDLAEKVGVSAQAVSKYERGMDTPSSPVLIRLAKSLGVRVEYLLRPINITLSQPLYRRRATLSKKNENEIQARVQDWLERYLGIETILASQSEFKMPEIKRQVKVHEDVERIAMQLRQTWELGLDPIDGLVEVLESHGVKVGIVPAADDFDALTLYANDTLPVIVVREGVPGDRQRFSIAHELGHIIMKIPDDWSDADIEKAAHRFAGAFLAPAPNVVAELGKHREKLDHYELHLLKHKYGMSMQAWIYRASDLGILSRTAVTSMFKLFRANNWNRVEPGDSCPPEKMDRLERLVIRAIAEDVISDSRASELLGKPLTEFWKQASEQHEGFPLPAYR